MLELHVRIDCCDGQSNVVLSEDCSLKKKNKTIMYAQMLISLHDTVIYPDG